MTVWNGGEVWVGTRTDRPFIDWAGEVRSQDYGHLRYCVPGKGGGSICAVYDLRTGAKIRHYWIGDPSDRAGVYLPDVPPPDPVYRVGVPPLWAGATGSPIVFLSFDSAESEQWVRDVFAEAARLLTPAGFFVTTVRPNKSPGHYVTAIVGAPTTWHGGAVLGVAPSKWSLHLDEPAKYQPLTVWVGPNAGSAIKAGGCVGHEVGHTFFLGHATDGDTGNLMAESFRPGANFSPADLDKLRGEVSRARAAWH